MGRINYGFGRDYLKDWTLTDALREVFQNYIDYGEYDVQTVRNGQGQTISVIIKNDYNPDSLEFLRVGNTSKNNGESIGRHGEGLKAAFLIFTRENCPFIIKTNKYQLKGKFDYSEEIGDTMYIEFVDKPYNILDSKDKDKFVTEFTCSAKIYDDFIESLLKPDDILYRNDWYGDLLRKSKGIGKIYSGGLFVCELPNLNASYNIRPRHLNLDRDRRVPRDWDIDWATSQIYGSYLTNKEEDDVEEKDSTSIDNLNARDLNHINELPDSIVNNVKSVKIENKIQFVDKTTGDIIHNDNVKRKLLNHPKFKKEKELSYKEKLNMRIAKDKRKKATTLLREFKRDYCQFNEDMQIAIDSIIYKLNKK